MRPAFTIVTLPLPALTPIAVVPFVPVPPLPLPEEPLPPRPPAPNIFPDDETSTRIEVPIPKAPVSNATNVQMDCYSSSF